MNSPIATPHRGLHLEAALILILGLGAGLTLALATSLPAKWTLFLIFMVLALGAFLIVREREKMLLYLSVVLTSVVFGFFPVFIESAAAFPWPIRGFRITIFEVVFLLMFVSWLLRLSLNQALKVRFYPWVTIPFLLIWLISAAGLSRAVMPGVIKVENLWVLLESWLIFLYFANNIRDRQMVINILLVLLATGVLQALLGLGQFFTGGTLGLTIFGEGESYMMMQAGVGYVSRVMGTFGHPNALAGYLVMLFLINLALFWAPIAPRLKILLIPMFLLISCTLTLTFSRGAWLALGLSGMVTVYLCIARRSRRLVLSLLVALFLMVVFFVTSMGVITPLRERLFEEDYGAARSRVPMSQVALTIISQHPWLGVGLGDYTAAAPYYDKTKEGISITFPYPVHNEFMLIAGELGIPALVLFLVMLGYIFIQLLRFSRSREDPILPYIAIALAGSYLGWFIFQQTRFDYVLLKNSFWLLAGLSLALVNLNGKEAGALPHSNHGPHKS